MGHHHHEPLDKKQIDAVMNLYMKCFHHMKWDVTQSDLPSDFLKDEKLGKYAVDQLWSYLLFLRSGLKRVLPDVDVNEQIIARFKRISFRLTEKDVTRDPSGRVLFPAGMKVENREQKNHIMNAILSILHSLSLRGDVADVAFVSSLLVSGDKSEGGEDGKDNSHIIHFLRYKALSGNLDAIANIVRNVLGYHSNSSVMSRVLYFSSLNKGDDHDHVEDLFDDRGDYPDNYDEGENGDGNGEEKKMDEDENEFGHDDREEEHDDHDDWVMREDSGKKKTLAEKMQDLLESDVEDEEDRDEGQDDGDYADDYGRFDNDD